MFVFSRTLVCVCSTCTHKRVHVCTHECSNWTRDCIPGALTGSSPTYQIPGFGFCQTCRTSPRAEELLRLQWLWMFTQQFGRHGPGRRHAAPGGLRAGEAEPRGGGLGGSAVLAGTGEGRGVVGLGGWGRGVRVRGATFAWPLITLHGNGQVVKSKHLPTPVLEASESTNKAIQAGGSTARFVSCPSRFLLMFQSFCNSPPFPSSGFRLPSPAWFW